MNNLAKPDFNCQDLIGIKYDKDKLRYDLVPPEVLKALAQVYTFGAAKYGENTWQNVAPYRYYAALMRHCVAYKEGETVDAESGLPPMAHALWNAGALLYLAQKTK